MPAERGKIKLIQSEIVPENTIRATGSDTRFTRILRNRTSAVFSSMIIIRNPRFGFRDHVLANAGLFQENRTYTLNPRYRIWNAKEIMSLRLSAKQINVYFLGIPNHWNSGVIRLYPWNIEV